MQNITPLLNQLEGFGYVLPKSIKPLRESADAIRSVDVRTYSGPASPIQSDEAESTLIDYAKSIALETVIASMDGSQFSAIERARQALIRDYQNQIVEILRGDPGVFQAIKGVFDNAGATLSESIESLPDELSYESIARSGGQASEALSTALTASGSMQAVVNFLSMHKATLGIQLPSEKELQLTQPRTYTEQMELRSAFGSGGTGNELERQIGCGYVYAARNGVPITLNSEGSIQSTIEGLEEDRSRVNEEHPNLSGRPGVRYR